ncbi:8-amino-7-oxononanoate synthase [Nautilia profundicola AmH]|uniref:8-amino-7-oxononanoate synthase n=1 Tax=Nautilia profundicola (strain ATCC BAA-1463 / DSM 18972 / AmH) TaxID=598659 RepID=B9L7F5_NAUPA|nr:pyridoxal phosphate-dependent aminotransferase family protein [Nautilia profundicola]ACM93189.1 8-amino-7-oxononanoate synthase [Nautilia profundicola AmH]
MYNKELEVLKKKNRLRERKIYPQNTIDLASNDYLGLAENKTVRQNAFSHAMEFDSHGAKASMLVNGYHPAHRLLEEKLKALNGFEEALVLGSGFLANMALFELGRRGDLFLIDEEYHASGIVGSRLTGAEVRFFKHNDIKDLIEKSKDCKSFKRVFTAVEGVYSMAGDKVDKNITDYAQQIGTLIIDEAHSVGVLGENLMGITDEYSLNPEKTVKMGTLGKALGSYGAYILANEEIISYLLNRAKSVIYTTALSPVDALLAYYALEEIEKNRNFYKNEINKRNLILNSDSLIKILPAQDNKALLLKQKQLFNRNILIGAIRPPTVQSPIFRVIGRVSVEIDIISKTIDFLKE